MTIAEIESHIEPSILNKLKEYIDSHRIHNGEYYIRAYYFVNKSDEMVLAQTVLDDCFGSVYSKVRKGDAAIRGTRKILDNLASQHFISKKKSGKCAFGEYSYYHRIKRDKTR